MTIDNLVRLTTATGPGTDGGAAETRPRAGRPTRQEAERRTEELLDAALDMFLERGFELTTIDAICARVNTTKRTVYARFEDKASLFHAAVQRAADRWNAPLAAIEVSDADDLEEALIAIARLRLDIGLTQEGLRLQRLLNAEAARFPDTYRFAYRQGTLPAIRQLADLFRRRAERGEIVAQAPEVLASCFLSLAVGGISRGAVLGLDIDTSTIDASIRYSVSLFMNGVRPRA